VAIFHIIGLIINLKKIIQLDTISKAVYNIGFYF